MNPKSQKTFNTVAQFFRNLSVHLSIFGLLVGPLPLVGAESKKSEKESDGWKNAQVLLNQFTQTYASAIQSQANMQQQAGLLQQLQVQPIRSKYFPNCQIAPMTPSPKGVCDNVSDSNTLQMARFYQQMADRNIDMYEKLKRDGGAGKVIGFNKGETYLNNSGISCLRQNQALVDSQLQDKLNYLEGLKAKIAKQSQLFKEQNQKLLDGMRDINSELNGGGNTADDKSRNFATLLKGSKCGEFLPSDVLTGKKSGLRGMTAFMEKPGKGKKSLKAQASFMIKDQSKIKNQLENSIKKVTDLINRNGVGDANSFIKKAAALASQGSIKFGNSFNNVMATEVMIHRENYDSIKKELSTITDSKGNPIYNNFPDLDRNFTQKVSEVNPRNLIRNTLIEDCITFNGSLQMDQVLGSLRHKSFGNKGTTIIRLRDELSKVLNSNSAINNSSYIEDKLAAIKKIDEHYGSGKITVKLDSSYFGNNASHGYTPYELFSNIYKQCEQKYEAGQIDNGKKQRVENALKRLNEFKNEQRVFASSLADKISNQVLNCSSSGEATSGSCSEASLTTTSDDFCLSSAVSCAQNVNSCYNRIENEITTRVNKQKTIATQYNTNVEKYIASQEAYYNQLKAQFSQETGVLKNFFQGANFSVVEKDKLFVEMPKLSLDKELGLQLRDPSMDFTKNLPKAINSLKRMMTEQKEKIAQKIEKHIEDQKEVLSKNIDVWREIASTCANSEQGYIAMVNQKNKEMADAYKEQEGKVQNFCNKYNMLRQSSVPACDGDLSPESLMSDSIEIASRIDSDVRAELGKFNDFCNSYNNDKNAEGDEIVSDISMDLQICDPDSNGKFDGNIDEYFEDQGIDFNEYAEMEIDGDDYKALSKAEQALVKKIQSFKDVKTGYCQEIRKNYAKQKCSGAEDQSCATNVDDDDLSKYLYDNDKKITSQGGRLLKITKLVSRINKSTKNAAWSALGEQEIADCTANNNTQTAFKDAMNDIMALQKGMMQSKISQ